LVKNYPSGPPLNLENRISELIELARGEVGLIKIIPAPLDMEMLIRKLSRICPVAAGKGLSLYRKYSSLPKFTAIRIVTASISHLLNNL
jgi:signal transduction histidine kinase